MKQRLYLGVYFLAIFVFVESFREQLEATIILRPVTWTKTFEELWYSNKNTKVYTFENWQTDTALSVEQNEYVRKLQPNIRKIADGSFEKIVTILREVIDRSAVFAFMSDGNDLIM